MKRNNFFTKFIGVILFILVLLKIDLTRLWQIFTNSNKLIILFTLVIVFPLMLLTKVMRWNYIKRIQKINFSLLDSFHIYVIGLSLGTVTPGKFGEFFKVFYLTKSGYSAGRSFVSVFLDKFVDLLLLMLIAIIGILYFIMFYKLDFLNLLLIALSLLILFFLCLNKRVMRKGIRFLFRYLVPRKSQKIRRYFIDFYRYIILISFTQYCIIFCYTLINWLLYFFIAYLLAISLGIAISFIFLLFAMSLSCLLNLLPISVSGIGVRDVLLIFLFSLAGIGKESAIAFSILILIFLLLPWIFGLISWFIKPLPFKIPNTLY